MGCLPQAMIEMRRVKGEGPFRAESEQAVEQDDGVGSARDRDHHPFSRLDKPVRLDGPPNRGKHLVSHARTPPLGQS